MAFNTAKDLFDIAKSVQQERFNQGLEKLMDSLAWSKQLDNIETAAKEGKLYYVMSFGTPEAPASYIPVSLLPTVARLLKSRGFNVEMAHMCNHKLVISWDITTTKIVMDAESNHG